MKLAASITLAALICTAGFSSAQTPPDSPSQLQQQSPEAVTETAPVQKPDKGTPIKDNSQMTNIAVLTLKNADGVSASEADLITERLKTEIFRIGTVNIMERNQMDEILKEQGFQQSGACTDDACMIEVGQLLGVQQLASGSIGQLGSLYMINLRLIRVETGQVIRIVSEDVKGSLEDVVTLLPNLARNLMGLESLARPAMVNRAHPVKVITEAEKPGLRPNVNSGMLIVNSTPSGAAVIINDKQSGVTPFTDNTLVPGSYTVKVALNKYKQFSESFDLSAGSTKKIKADLVYKYGILTVQSKPESASVSLNDKAMGVTPCRNDTLNPGTYKLRLSLPNYEPVMSKIVITQNKSDTLAFNLYTKSYLDSLKVIKKQHARGKRIARRIIFGTLAAGSAGAGFYFNQKTGENLEEEKSAWEVYNSDESGNADIYAGKYDNYMEKVHRTDESSIIRNIAYGITGALGLCFIISIPF